MSISIKKIDYNNKDDSRILEAVLNNWFNNPKELNLFEPRLKYPFNYNKLKALTNNSSNVESFTLINDKLIIGIGSILFNTDSSRAHIMHIFIDTTYRRRGLAIKIIKYLEKLANNKKMKILSLRLMPKNEPAKKLYEKIGFKENLIQDEALTNSSANNKKTIKLYKQIN